MVAVTSARQRYYCQHGADIELWAMVKPCVRWGIVLPEGACWRGTPLPGRWPPALTVTWCWPDHTRPSVVDAGSRADRGNSLSSWPMDEPIVAIVMAAGIGSRFGGPIPKQVTELAGKAVVAVAVESLAAGGCSRAVVVVKEGMENHVRFALAAAPIPVHFVTGGNSRQESVRRGLEFVDSHPVLSKASKVLIHDAVRPLVPAYVVADVIKALDDGATAGAPAMPVVDTIRQVDGDTSTVVDRDTLRAIQTPQGFDRATITQCHRRMADDGVKVTDDLSCCELYDHQITLVEGSRAAMKITEPIDIDIAEVFSRAAAGAGNHSGKRVRLMATKVREKGGMFIRHVRRAIPGK